MKAKDIVHSESLELEDDRGKVTTLHFWHCRLL